MVGEFEHTDGSSYIMLVNRDFLNPLTAQVKLRKTPRTLFEVSKSNGARRAATGYSPWERELKVEFAPGDGRLLCLKE